MDPVENPKTTYRVKGRIFDSSEEKTVVNTGSIIFSAIRCLSRTTIYAAVNFLFGFERVFKFTGYDNKDTNNDCQSMKLDEKIIRFNANHMKQTIAYCFSTEFDLTFEVLEIFQPKDTQQFLPNTDTLANDFAALLTEEETKDVAFTIDSKTISAHKFILSARSPVFKRMFQIDMLEKNSANPIELNDVSEEAFAEFLAFLYCNRYSKPKVERELLYLADKYDVESLKATVANALLQKIDVGNAIDTMKLFNRFRIPKLNGEVANFIVKNKMKNKKNVFTEKIKKLRATHPALVDLIDMAEKFNAN